MRGGDVRAAGALYEAILGARPADREAQLNLGAIRLYQNDLTAAEPLLRSAAAGEPPNGRAARLLAELLRRQAEAQRRTLVPGGEVDVTFLTSDPLPVVRVVANGKAANFVIDTGADVDLEPDFAAAIGVTTKNAENAVFAGGKRAPLQQGMLDSLDVGAATAVDVPIHVFPMHAGAFFPTLHIAGALGTTYFERFLATLDYPHRRLTLRPRSFANSATFQSDAQGLGATIVPCLLVGDHFVVASAQVNEAPTGLFLFDSGLAGGGLMPSAALISAAHLPIDRARAQTGLGVAGAVTAIPFTARRIAVGTAVQSNVRGIYTPEGDPFAIFPFTVWGIVSNDFLDHYEYTVDFDAMTIVLLADQS